MTRAEAEQLINQRGLTVWANVRTKGTLVDQ